MAYVCAQCDFFDGDGAHAATCPSCGGRMRLTMLDPRATAIATLDEPQGAARNPYQAPSAGSPRVGSENSGKALASLILGILSLLGWCLPIVGLPMTIVGLVLGFKGQKAINGGTAVAGIILNFIGLALSVFNGVLGAWLAVQRHVH